MTESESIAQIDGMLKLMRDMNFIENCARDLYDSRFMPRPRGCDNDELVAFVTDEQTRAGEPCEPRPIFQEEK